ncbi:MAG: hypothetical protein KC475_07210 [Cyanobacteria bacterium HKST-UBA03]|nr:hypothetical protein [Cyanobacteria bacterium HKST-UBA03]
MVLAVVPAVALVLAGQSAWGPLWMLFGTTNQLIACMSLMVLWVYLLRTKRPSWAVAAPFVVLTVSTTISLCMNLYEWATTHTGNMVTIGLGTIILILEIWMITEAVLMLCRQLKHPTPSPLR